VDIVGYVFLGLIALAVLVAGVFAVASAPDIARYLRMRRM
jgi:hypothetical protein